MFAACAYLIAFAEGDEVIAPRHELSARVDATLQVVIPAGSIHLVTHVVFARPQQLDRDARDLLRDRRRFRDVVVGETTAETATGLHHVQRDVGILETRRARGHADTTLRRLTRRPHFELAVLELRDAVLGLERRVRDERIHVRGLDNLRRARKPLLDVAVGAQLVRVRALAEFIGLRLESLAALRRRRMRSPRHLQLFARGVREPPAVGHDRNTAHEFLQVGAAFDRRTRASRRAAS